MGSIPGSRRSPGVENGNSLKYSCLENPMDRGGAWGSIVHDKESDTAEVTEHTYTFIISQFIWIRNLGAAQLGFRTQYLSQGYYHGVS